MKSILLPINPMYRLYENGTLLNTQRGKIVKPFSHSKQKKQIKQYDILNIQTGKRQKFAKHRLKYFYFGIHNFKNITQLSNIKITLNKIK